MLPSSPYKLQVLSDNSGNKKAGIFFTETPPVSGIVQAPCEAASLTPCQDAMGEMLSLTQEETESPVK